MQFASLCVLSYERYDFLVKSLESLTSRTSYPFELVINDDGSTDKRVKEYLYNLLERKKLSNLIINAGSNMGVGKSLRNCIGVSTGEYIFKLDADLEYKPLWLEKAVSILDKNRDVGCLGLFDYRNYDLNDKRFEKLEEREDCFVVTDFVNSGYGFKRQTWLEFGEKIGDDGWQCYVQSQGRVSLIPKEDLVINFGFGSNSIYIENGKAREKSEFPLVFNER